MFVDLKMDQRYFIISRNLIEGIDDLSQKISKSTT